MTVRNLVITLLAAAVSGFSAEVRAEKAYDWTATGSYKIGATQTISIPEAGEVYLKLGGIKAGQSYTIIANGSGAAVAVVYTYADSEYEWDADLATSIPDTKTADQDRCIVDSDSWIDASIVKDPEWDYDPGEWDESKVSPRAYYLYVSGDDGATITVSSMNGAVEEPIPVGDIDNPKVIKPTTVPATYSSKFVDGAYYFNVSAVAGSKYLLATTKGTEGDPITFKFDESAAEYTADDVSGTVTTEGNAAYLVTVTKSGTLAFHIAGNGTSFGLTTQSATQGTLGRVTVTTKGVKGTWSIKGASGSYASGESVSILGTQTIVFARASGFTTPANQTVTPTDTTPDVEVVGVYTDTFDPKDDVISGAVKISPAAKVATAARTLFGNDVDHFAFSAKEGVYYKFALADLVGDAVIRIFKKGDATETVLAGPATAITKFSPGKGDFIVRVAHGTPGDAQYALQYSSADVGAISFAKTAVSVKKTAGQVALTVNRSAGEGKVRVLYGTVNGTAQPGVDYFAQSGELVWANGDKKAKTITIKLIPELFAEENLTRKFQVQLKAVEEDEVGDDEYLAAIAAGKDVATVTVTETKAKAPSAVKAATTKTESVPLETGTYQGVIAEDGSALTNGFPALASVTFTAKNAATKALSAKVVVAGKTYTFAADAWNEEESDGEYAAAVLTQKQKVGTTYYENTLRVFVRKGQTADDSSFPCCEKKANWIESGASVELTMNVPDANNKGVQEEIVYRGELFRDNAKIQDYLYAVTNVVGYYTVALVPTGVSTVEGIPAGNGYLTLTVDNKGKAKVAGVLADGTTKPSCSSIVAVRDTDEDDVIDTLLVPVFVAKSPYCFGGTLRLVRGEGGKFVVDSSTSLVWNNDNAALTYDGEEGWSIEIDPVGGYFNTVNNLQTHYLTCAFGVSTADVEDLPEEVLSKDYAFVTSVQPNEYPVSLNGNAVETDKKSLTKVGGVYDLENGVNPCNVQVKLTRATGLVTGSFSVWTANEEGKQKEISGIKHYGILLLSRDEAAPLDPDVMTAGFFTQSATLTYYNEKNQKKTRKYTASLPFNILAVDQGEPDWYADDWGERP